MLEDLQLSVAMGVAEKAHIRRVLDITNWNRLEAARLLGIAARTMYYKCEQYGFQAIKSNGPNELRKPNLSDRLRSGE